MLPILIINCFPLDHVHLIDSLILLTENPIALLANIQALSSLMHFCKVCQKQNLSWRDFKRDFHKHLGLLVCILAPFGGWLTLPLSSYCDSCGITLRGVYVWFIFHPTQQKTCSKINSLFPSVRWLTWFILWFIVSTVHLCQQFVLQSIPSCIEKQHQQHRQRLPPRDVFSAHLYLICKFDKIQWPKCGVLPLCLNNDMI